GSRMCHDSRVRRFLLGQVFLMGTCASKNRSGHCSAPCSCTFLSMGTRSTRESRFFRRRAQRGGAAEPKAMIDCTLPLSISQQADLVGSVAARCIYLPQPVSVQDLALMRGIDELPCCAIS